ncbi:hypothetical protein IscW_ISCW014743 [Ixodes scapularis]|uniref:Monocarboxylate transporter n=1 Tax=Ixodes scapularis TaxID=6945 RepID=B7QID1_IXOSC|nr:hypothetical protein IscW_ISCW014743 [Ixodes scapularis]|eukprot:XP_002414938.1 hypothetical protein IscW_ISCW014743 [Ixodes scapularis]
MPQTADYIRTEYGTPEMFLLIGALSFNAFPAAFVLKMQLLNVTVFFLVNVDLATDGGIDTSQAVYLAHVYSVGDFIVRLLSGLIVDRGYISLATAMLLGFSGCAAGFEALVWSTSMASFVTSSMLVGAGGGFMAPLCGPILTSDFEGRSLPVLFGGLMFMNGLVLIAIPPLVASIFVC